MARKKQKRRNKRELSPQKPGTSQVMRIVSQIITVLTLIFAGVVLYPSFQGVEVNEKSLELSEINEPLVFQSFQKQSNRSRFRVDLAFDLSDFNPDNQHFVLYANIKQGKIADASLILPVPFGEYRSIPLIVEPDKDKENRYRLVLDEIKKEYQSSNMVFFAILIRDNPGNIFPFFFLPYELYLTQKEMNERGEIEEYNLVKYKMLFYLRGFSPYLITEATIREEYEKLCDIGLDGKEYRIRHPNVAELFTFVDLVIENK